MQEALFLILAFLVGAASASAMGWEFVRHARKRAETAEDRLYGSWKEGNLIPSRPEDDAQPEEIVALPRSLAMVIDEWEDADTREALESAFRQEMSDGFGHTAILRHYLDGHFDAKPPISMG